MRTVATESCANTIQTCLPSFRSPLSLSRLRWQLRANDMFHVQNTRPPNPYSPKRVANRTLRRPPSNRVRGKVLRPNRPSLGDLDGARALPPHPTAADQIHDGTANPERHPNHNNPPCNSTFALCYLGTIVWSRRVSKFHCRGLPDSHRSHTSSS